MNASKYIIGIAMAALAVMPGCKKEQYTDFSFVQTANSPDKLSAFFDITQDNTGLVTITPNGEGASSYQVYYGDNTTTPVSIAPGKNTQHVYAEGVYNVKIVGHGLNGKTTEATKQLTVSFRAPENMEVTAAADASNQFKYTVSAKAN